MEGQPTLFDPPTSTRRVLKDDEVYCPDCRAVGRQISDYPDCPVCGGDVRVAGAVIENLPGGAHAPAPPWGRPV